MRISWIGEPASSGGKRMAKAWLERAPAGVRIIRTIDPSCDVMFALSLDALGISGAMLLGRERFRRKSILYLDNCLNVSDPTWSGHAEWLCKMVCYLIFPSEEDRSDFVALYPDIRTPSIVFPAVPIDRKSKKDKPGKGLGRSRSALPRELWADDAMPSGDVAESKTDKIIGKEIEDLGPELEPQPTPYEASLDMSAAMLWAFIKSLV